MQALCLVVLYQQSLIMTNDRAIGAYILLDRENIVGILYFIKNICTPKK